MDIFKTVNTQDWNGETQMYIEDINFYISISMRNITMIDLANAGKTGKECLRVSAQPKKCFDHWNECKNFFDLVMDSESLKKWFDELILKAEFAEGKSYFDINDNDAHYYFEKQKGINVFSPFAQFKRLKSSPKKWTKSHVIKALMTGQFKSLNKDAVYTDDYYADAQNNYGKKEYLEAVELIQKIIEGCSGWRFYADEENAQYININCYTFDYNHFLFDVDGTKRTFEYVTEKKEREEKEFQEALRLRFVETRQTRRFSEKVLELKYSELDNLLVLTLNEKFLGSYTQEQESEATKAFYIKSNLMFKEEIEKVKVVSKKTINRSESVFESKGVNRLDSHYEEIIEKNKSQDILVVESVTFDKDSFELLANNLLNFPIRDFIENGGGSVLPDKFADKLKGIEYAKMTNEQRDYFNKNCVSVFTEILKEGTVEKFFIDCQGYEYARYVGTKEKINLSLVS
jgi:hypothetical protein